METQNNVNEIDEQREAHNQRWHELTAEMAACKTSITQSPTPVSKEQQGSLIVIGSGLQGLGFTMDSEALIRMADKVFYCVSSPPTQLWLREVRPDAYDLYVLYDDTKPRYHTYMQMTEAMLHYVRKGQKVVCIFYGHPGIFVLSTHRAIAIAKREGHYAVMKPGISALDCLCADLGVDPSYPGMQTFEASEVLLRKRYLDIQTHLVLWQVGLIGEMGYRRKGFINDKFPILIEYLQSYYGEDYEITHYIAARHATFEPTIAVYKLSDMLDPRVRKTFTGISTFYIPPKEAATTDMEMAIRLGFAKEGDKPAKTTRFRVIDAYSPREMAAIDEFDHFRVPKEYQFQPNTRAAEFLLELARDTELQDLYLNDPVAAVSDDVFPGLNNIEKNLLAMRSESYAQLAAKGGLVDTSPNEKLVLELLSNAELSGLFRQQLIDNKDGDDFLYKANGWIKQNGFQAALLHLPSACDRVNASMLLPWTGVYHNADTGDVVTVVGDPNHNSASLVYINLTPVVSFSFNNQVLTWYADEGNEVNGELKFIVNTNSQGQLIRSVSGKVWPKDCDEPSEHTLSATELTPDSSTITTLIGQYETEISQDGNNWQKGPSIRLHAQPPFATSQALLAIDGQAIDVTKYEDQSVYWNNSRIDFSYDEDTRNTVLHSSQTTLPNGEQVQLRGLKSRSYSQPLIGYYSGYLYLKGQWQGEVELKFNGKELLLGGHKVDEVHFDDNKIEWQNAGGNLNNGIIQFLIDPITQVPKCVGFLWKTGEKPAQANFVAGMVAPPQQPSSIADFNGHYISAVHRADGTLFPDGPDLLFDAKQPNELIVALGDENAVVQLQSIDSSPGTVDLIWNDIPNVTGQLCNFRQVKLNFEVDSSTGLARFKGINKSDTRASGAHNWLGYGLASKEPGLQTEQQLPIEVRKVLTILGLQSTSPNSHLIWSRWQRVRFTFRLLNGLVRKMCEAQQPHES
ncbi:hypothetical protein CWB99_09580 [Pseudoalteromonas rubra]|uniref:Tetrapyrrole methylase domain-containing protein n=1 Tax=Pseudoalteromonas rubra TaxID=43658 RepID=A0A5S3WNK3_9GAMM|nr:SAM-dependent methyltransferase [Pseudoalteromonas rubra]TMP29011.1 hypothetical protein CWB99_09580 [Pseudoalteromonas rubra]TMP29189.1 hypothetical protein CWC00_19795 [Pseudoalteromonas rubra]